jgi:hypothetical protein
VDAHTVLFAGNSLRLILFSSSSSSSIALLVLLVLLRRRGDDDVNALLVLFPSMISTISMTKDDGFGVNKTNATPRREKTTHHFARFVRVAYIFLGLLAVVFRLRSKKSVHE